MLMGCVGRASAYGASEEVDSYGRGSYGRDSMVGTVAGDIRRPEGLLRADLLLRCLPTTSMAPADIGPHITGGASNPLLHGVRLICPEARLYIASG
jgi:hypothetical protein